MLKKFTLFFLFGMFPVILFAQGKQWTAVLPTLPERPDGAFIRLGSNQGFQLFGVSSAAYDSDADNDDMLRVEREASIKARAELIKFMQQNLSSADSIRDSFRQAEREVDTEKGKQKESQTISEQSFLSEVQSSSAAMMKGIVTLKVIKIPRGNGGIFKALVGVSSTTLQTVEVLGTQAAAAPQVENSKKAGGETAVAGKKDTEWIVCIGRGADRNGAVRAALIEGIQQVYGVYLENEETVKKRFEQFKSGSVSATRKTSAQSQSMLTQSKGFIREYRILSVTNVGDAQEARVKAWIVNPRAGGFRTILLYPMSIRMEKETNQYNVGPELRLSGAEIASMCSSRFEDAFNQTNRFVVLNKSDLEKVLVEQNETAKLVLAGRALPLEMAKSGQLLCADYIFIPEFEDISYSRKIGFDKKAGKFLPNETLSLSFKYRLLDVRTGSRIKNEEMSVRIGNDEIRQLPEDNGNKDDMLKLLMKKAVKQLSQKVNF